MRVYNYLMNPFRLRLPFGRDLINLDYIHRGEKYVN